MKILVTGVNGQLGHDVIYELCRRGNEGIGTDIQPDFMHTKPEEKCFVRPVTYISLDITDRDAVQSTIRKVGPDAVIHCAAWTAVDLAEEEGKAAIVRDINVNGTKYIAEACRETGARLLYISTDYVFDGQGMKPWEPDCRDYRPLNVYGQSKLDGELAVSGILDSYFIVRTAWVFGTNGRNFINAMLAAAESRGEVRVVNDQVGTPTYTPDLAGLLVDMVGTTQYGYYHATNEGNYISWYDFAVEIYRQAGIAAKVIPVTTAEYGLRTAMRPFNSRLDRKKLAECGFEPLPHWQDAVRRYLKELGYGTKNS